MEYPHQTVGRERPEIKINRVEKPSLLCMSRKIKSTRMRVEWSRATGAVKATAHPTDP